MSNRISMQPIKSVALTCDFLRAQLGPEGFTNFQFKNLIWLEKLIGTPRSWASWGVKSTIVTVPTKPEAFQLALNNNEIFSRYSQDAHQAWATLYNAHELEIFPETLKQLLTHDLVIGFELPPVLKKTLNKFGKKYISIYIHPVRFLRDLCFLITTNCNRIASIIEHTKVPTEEIKYQSRRFSAMFSRSQSPALALPDNLPVLIGQTGNDSVLIRDEKFANWENYEDEISQNLRPFSELLFLEHPYSQNNAISMEYFRGRHGKTVISLRGNSYGVIFSQLTPPFYMTLASSLGVEAGYAGHKCIFLSEDPREKFIIDEVDVPSSGIVSHSIIKDVFWKTIFSGKYMDKRSSGIIPTCAFPLGDNFIRDSLESWDFHNLRSDLKSSPVSKRVLPTADIPEDQLHSINTILCGGSRDCAKQLIEEGHIERSWGTVEMFAKPFTSGMQSKINFAHPSASHYLVEGFHAPEAWGVWSKSKDAKIVLPLDLMNIRKVRVDISMFVKANPEILNYAPVLQVVFNGREVGCVLFRKFSQNDQKIAFSGILDIPTCQLDFHISHTSSSELPITSSDTRELGFGLYALNIKLSSANSPHEEDSDTYKFWGLQKYNPIDLTQSELGDS